MTSRRSSMSSNAGAPLPPMSEGGKSPFLERAETVERLEKAIKRKSQTEQELTSLVRVRSTTPGMSPAEVSVQDREIKNLYEQISAMNNQILTMQTQIDRQDTLIAQQQATIRQQSKAISNPRGREASAVRTPQRNAEARGYYEQATYCPPPQYGNQHGSSYGSNRNHSQQRVPDNGRNNEFGSYIQAPQPASFQPVTGAMLPPPPPPPRMNRPTTPPSYAPPHQAYENVTQRSDVPRIPTGPVHSANEFGSPMETTRNERPVTPARETQQARTGNVYTPMSLSGYSEHDPFGPAQHGNVGGLRGQFSMHQAPQPSQYSHERAVSTSRAEEVLAAPVARVITVVPIDENNTALIEQLEKVFASCKNYAWNHANFPNTSGDNALPQDLKNRILSAASKETAFPLMRSTDTRYWLITKVVIRFVIKHILRVNTFAGLHEEADQAIEAIRNTMYSTTPPQLRYVMLYDITTEIWKILSHPESAAFMDWLNKQRGEKLYWEVRSLQHRPTMRDQEDIAHLIKEAHRLAEMMYTSTDEFRFHFFEVGDRFDRFCMENVDPRYFRRNDEELRNRGATVRLCAIPEVTVRKNNARGATQEMKLLKGRVLLKVRGDD